MEKQLSLNNLLPCPFCGETAFLSKDEIECSCCASKMYDSDQDNLIKRWNARTQSKPDPKQEIYEALDTATINQLARLLNGKEAKDGGDLSHAHLRRIIKNIKFVCTPNSGEKAK